MVLLRVSPASQPLHAVANNSIILISVCSANRGVEEDVCCVAECADRRIPGSKRGGRAGLWSLLLAIFWSKSDDTFSRMAAKVSFKCLLLAKFREYNNQSAMENADWIPLVTALPPAPEAIKTSKTIKTMVARTKVMRKIESNDV